MLIPLLALILGAPIGLAVRGRQRIVMAVAIASHVLAVLALAAQFIPGGVEECHGSTSGASSCQALPAITAWSGPLPFLIAFLLIVLALAPIVSVRTSKWWVAAASAALQAVPQVISFGGFIDWAPALLATVVVSFALYSGLMPTIRSREGM